LVPDNPIMRAAGMKDDPKAARRYIQLETGNRFNAKLVDAFLENGPKAIDFFNKETVLKMTHRPYSPDYHPDKKGAALGGRMLDALEYNGKALGRNLARLRPPIKEFTILDGIQLGRIDLFHFVRMTRQWPSFVHAQSNSSFPSSRRSCAKEAHAPRKRSGPPLENCSTRSRPRSAGTTSGTADMSPSKSKLL
jgi:FAD binding domain